MARTRHRRELKSEINIVPLLDVLLVLLLIFMATAPIISQSVKVELPDATQSKIVSGIDNLPIILEVSGVGQYSVIIDGHREELLPPEQIAAITKAALAKNPPVIFLIGGAKDVPYEEVIKALNILHQAGIKSVGFMTQPI
ncbi:Biopolymer transport protein ExbD [Arsenophonus endosymbiont of Aleurodicus floccissimus]|uniref:colicin uptake protein TolR n=1 Tax=Arsenophonus endosymbiont of Aleurodicus floccissimus TaxID=2152761 RepID=UPI000E6B198F|nr:colicin uptake protein TolR [Arsenophonus endosymbiont of Aleurodicus floccissimus]SPP30961.1 Biopolymer transport protein ExbD [Arsenophonus endosymbiont of Aleurodicus floccissimus]